MPNFRITTVSFAALAVLALAGCGRESPVRVRPSAVGPQEKNQATTTERTPRHRTWADPQFPAGNDRTRQFLVWAGEQYALYCMMELDANGDCIELNVHPCWPTKDEELKHISELQQIQSMSLYAASITDDGLRHLERMPALKKLLLVGASQISDDGLERLKRVKPNLEIDLAYRTAT